MDSKQQSQPLDIPEAETPVIAAPRKKTTARPAAPKKTTAPKKATQITRKPVKKKTSKTEDDLPVWLEKIVDWFIDIPSKLKKLPRFFKKLWRSWFYRIYFPLVALALVGIIIGCNWLNGFAADYEAAQPIHVADQVAQMFVNGDYAAIYPLDTAAQTIAGGDQDFYIQSLKDVATGKTIAWDTAFSSDKNVMKYDVTLDGARFASFTLVPSGQKTPHGNTLWRLGEVTTNVVTQEVVARQDPNNAPYRIQVLPDYVVTVDGATLTPEDVTRSGIALYDEGFLPESVTAPTLIEYGFFSENFPPQIAVTTAEGAFLTPKETSQNTWVCGPQEDETVKAQYSETIIKMAQRIAKYTTADVSRSTALDAVLSNSPAEDVLKKFNNGWAPSHKEESFENVELADFYVLSEDCITCRVSFDYILTSKRENDYTYPTNYTFCIVRRNGEGKLYNIVFH